MIYFYYTRFGGKIQLANIFSFLLSMTELNMPVKNGIVHRCGTLHLREALRNMRTPRFEEAVAKVA